MKSLLFLIAALAIILCTDGRLFRYKRWIDNCQSLPCPKGTVKCTMNEDNKDDGNVIVTKLQCIDESDVVLKEDLQTRKNDIPGMKISRQKTSVNIDKSIHSRQSNKQSWGDMQNDNGEAMYQTFQNTFGSTDNWNRLPKFWSYGWNPIYDNVQNFGFPNNWFDPFANMYPRILF